MEKKKRSLPKDEIPIIDVGPYMAGHSGAAEEAAELLRWVQEEIGFYYLVNHGVDEELIQAALGQLKAFYDLPMEEKLKLKVDERSTGYVPIKSTVYVTSDVADNTRKDLNEDISIVRERPANHPGIQEGRRFTGPNKWRPKDLLPHFKSTMLTYYQVMEDLGRSLLPLYALALDLTPDYFDELFTDPNWLTRNVHYPPEEPGEDQFGIAPHTDHGFITLLPISKVPGLEVKSQDGGWIKAKYIENAMVVNSGDFLAKWTNGQFLATPHRVLAPATNRYISALFYNPNWDVRCDALPTCVDAKNPAHEDGTTMLEHLCNYVDSNYTQSAGGTQDDKAFS